MRWEGEERRGRGGMDGFGPPSERKNTGHDFLFLTLKESPGCLFKGLTCK